MIKTYEIHKKSSYIILLECNLTCNTEIWGLDIGTLLLTHLRNAQNIKDNNKDHFTSFVIQSKGKKVYCCNILQARSNLHINNNNISIHVCKSVKCEKCFFVIKQNVNSMKFLCLKVVCTQKWSISCVSCVFVCMDTETDLMYAKKEGISN